MRALRRRSLVSSRGGGDASGRVFGRHFERGFAPPPLCTQFSLHVRGKLGEHVRIYVRRNVRTTGCSLRGADVTRLLGFTTALCDEVIGTWRGWSRLAVTFLSVHWIFLKAGHELHLDVRRESSEHVRVHVRGEVLNVHAAGVWCGIRTFRDRRH